jgi:hypothetical protein
MYHRKKLRRPQIYGIAGRKRHGKDTFARAVESAAALLPKASPFYTTHFADPLKNMACDIFGLTHEQMYADELKEAPLEKPIVMDLYLATMRTVTGLLEIQPAGLVAHTPRQVAQFFGTDYVRRIQDDYWIQHTINGLRPNLKGAAQRVLIPDTRFPNEAAALRAAGGRIIKIIRIDAPTSADEHPSEKMVDAIEPDLLLGVRTGDLTLVDRAAKLIAMNKFDRALSLDYRKIKPALEAYAGGASADSAARMMGHKSPHTLYFLVAYYGLSLSRRPQKQRVSHEVRNGLEHKWCSRCKEWKPLAAFNSCFNAWDKLNGQCRECAKKSNEHYELSWEGVYKRYSREAPLRGKTWALTIADLHTLWSQQSGLCAYTGQPLTFIRNDPNRVSIDRIDSTQGYTLNNVVLCGSRMNKMKNNMTLSEFISACRAVIEWRAK